MIAHAFHRWERRLASVDQNRFARQFEWGLDWLGLPEDATDPAAALSRYSAEVMAATEQTPLRKIREARLAIKVEKEMSKTDILERYLNVAYFGHRAYGVFAAAQIFFSKQPKDLTLAELREIESRVKAMQDRLLELEAEQRKSAWVHELTRKYPGLTALLESGRATLGEPKTPGLYAATGFRLPPGLTSQDLLDLDRGEH